MVAFNWVGVIFIRREFTKFRIYMRKPNLPFCNLIFVTFPTPNIMKMPIACLANLPNSSAILLY